MTKSIEDLIQADHWRMRALHALAQLDLPDGLIAAGFVRNLVWDDIHGYQHSPLNDVDVIYFDATGEVSATGTEQRLHRLVPDVNWEVKNQAQMHHRNHDRPYHSCSDAMRFWPEKETAVAVRLTHAQKIEVVAPFGLESLFSGHITHNSKRSLATFKHRVESKNWLVQWPQLKMVC